MDKLPLILEPEELQAHLENENIVIVDLCSIQHYHNHHIPGALHIEPGATQLGMPPAPGKLPSLERLQEIVDYLGITDNSHVIVYDDEGGGWAGRFIWLLDCIGFSQYSYLNGGLIAWVNEGFPVSDTPEIPEEKESTFSVSLQSTPTMDIEDLLSSLTDNTYNIWDARSAEEHNGVRSGSARHGKIPGAFHFEWTQAMDPSRHYRLKPLPQLKDTLLALGLNENKPIVTHCQTHHRSGLTYLIAKALGYPVKAYAGSWSEWGNREDTPVE